MSSSWHPSTAQICTLHKIPVSKPSPFSRPCLSDIGVARIRSLFLNEEKRFKFLSSNTMPNLTASADGSKSSLKTSEYFFLENLVILFVLPLQ